MPKLTIRDKEGVIVDKLEVKPQSNLRLAMLEHGYSPYTKWTQNLNCGGNGICATCGIWILESEPVPTHWHDKAAKRFGYPRLSCQITIESDMTIQLAEKWIWGKQK